MSELTVGWQADPAERGTLTLVYSCLITIFTCTWTVLHLNVPGRHDGQWTIALRKAKWMAITVLLPEFIFSKAICDLRLALKELHEFGIDLEDSKEYREKLKWSVSTKGIEHTYSWQVNGGPRARLLYWVLGLDPPDTRRKPAEKTAEHDKSNPVEKISSNPEDDGINRQAANKPPLSTYHTTQNWTLTHAYLANMGGLLYPFASINQFHNLEYYALEGIKLSRRYCWHGSHPLQGLVLRKGDIEDKSKQDWLLRCLTILQVIWLVLTVLVRSADGLPVSQLEIATVAFSISALATYAANWWKPKDVLKPILLQTPALGTSYNMSNRTKRFSLFLANPTKAEFEAMYIHDERRIRNDTIWMEGGVPLIFSIMAASALVFGGLHLIAWNFEFPSRAELLLWRASSLASMILPSISLGFNLYLNYLATAYNNNKLISFLIEKLKPLDEFPLSFRDSFKQPVFESWSLSERDALLCTLPGSRNFNGTRRREDSGWFEQDQGRKYRSAFAIPSYLRRLDRFCEEARKGPRTVHVIYSLENCFSGIEDCANGKALEFWDEFEDYLRSYFKASNTPIPEGKYLRHILEIWKHFREEKAKWRARKDAYYRISQFLLISSSIVYVASRLIILVLLFTSLRAAPKGIYEETPWAKFLSKIS